MTRRLFFLFYTLLYSIVLLFILPFEYLKRPVDLRKRWLRERFGFLPFDSADGISEYRVIWIHSVSVGEVIASVPFVQEILDVFPSVRVVLTTVTDTGQKVAGERLSGDVSIFYLPFDLPFSIRRFIRTIRPSLYISIETELWPNLFRLLKEEGVSVLIMNGRVSEDSFEGYRRIRFFMKEILDHVDLFCMQEAIYGERLKTLGVSEERIKITGNFKFDIKIDEYRHDWIRNLNRPVILAGSTHDGEEEIILDAFERLKGEVGPMTLIVAPRHPERFCEVEEIFKKRGLRYMRRSELDNRSKIGKLKETPVILIDVIGELASLYSTCDIAIIGGTFSGRGGHNPLEPAFWGKPILCGPDMRNFPFIEEFYQNGAAIKTSIEGLYNNLKRLLLSEDERLQMGKKAKEIYEARAGAIKRSVGLLERYLELSQPLTK